MRPSTRTTIRSRGLATPISVQLHASPGRPSRFSSGSRNQHRLALSNLVPQCVLIGTRAEGTGPRNVIAEVRREVPRRRGRPGYAQLNRKASLVEDFEGRFAVVVRDGAWSMRIDVRLAHALQRVEGGVAVIAPSLEGVPKVPRELRR